MFNDYYLLKRVQEEEGAVAYASVMDSFTYMGEVVNVPEYEYKGTVNRTTSSTIYMSPASPTVGDKVLFLKGSGEDVTVSGEQMKAVKLEDIIMKI